MAKIGEGDKRWIVEDRADGTNVHNWHWAETDCLDWSRNFLTNLLCNKTILSGQGNLYIKTKGIEKLDGEAYLNIRKGKIIPGYELSLVLSYEAEVRDPDSSSVTSNVEGTVEVPYIADENAGEDPEIRISVKDDGPTGKRVKEAFIEEGKPFVFEKIRDFVNAMAKGGPAKDDLEVKKVTVQKTASDSGSSNVSASNSGTGVKESRKKEEKRNEGFKTISMTEKFNCRAKDLYEILMDENRWKGFTQSNARISKEVGGEFSIFDGSVTGKNVELLEGKLIVQKWRFGSWPDGIESTVRLSFDEPESGLTVVKLTHTNVPEEDRYGNSTVVENTERGWRDIIFHRIRAVFGFGI
ncbi:activator of 90 kDa heat shock protein ATPase [Dorcoceras hygrometricum]|uniref:Activator of 90 kDa heat shock protein ATPase n=1 Tax=Dorcoceras hygrometricum TaxID=472368 RepID=A0A2Z7C082_9LAMI|nr:activator of 90 kDa heat shock protein ATPase [Dorcoceras hygrometricum]